jgi:outer membrane protein insertion porin family
VDRVLMLLHSTAGQPYSDLNIATDRDSILDYYYNDGYPEAKFEFTVRPASEPNHVNLKFVVTPGRRVYVRDVLITGLQRTQPDLVRDRISLRTGDPLSQEKITGSQRRLYDLGIFARVNTALQNPDGEEPTKYVLYSLEEAGRYSMNVGVGAEIGRIGGGATSLDSPAGATGFSPRFTFGVSRLNFLGLGHTVGVQTLLSTLEQRALVTYLAPQFEGNSNLSLQFSGLFDLSHDVRTFSARREEGSVQLGQKLSKANTIQYRLTFRKVNILGTPLITPELIPLLSQPVRVGLVSTGLIQDRRDDPLDAHRGSYNTLDLALASQALGSQTGYGRVVARNSTYHPLTKNLVLARSTSFGLIERYSGLPEIPLAERFFGGGPFSNRAFPDFQAGPRDLETGFPIGGNALFLNTVELRFPLVGDNLGGVLFNDIGNVYSAVNRISLRFSQRNLQDFDYAVHSYGFGIRYRTPIGPVRLDLSLSPNSPRFFGFKGTEDQLLFGGGQQVVQRINVFQFHFSLGEAF